MDSITIRWVNSTYCEIDDKSLELLKPILGYNYTVWVQGRFRKEPVERFYQLYRKVARKELYHFYTGLTTRVLEFCKENGIQARIKGGPERILPTAEPYLSGKTLRDDQFDLMMVSGRKQRGVILSPTRTGKTVIMMALSSRYPEEYILFAVNSRTVAKQTHDEYKDHGFDVGLVMGGVKWDIDTIRSHNITIGTIQSLSKLNPKHIQGLWSIIFIDEAHFASSDTGQYAKFLHKAQVPMVLGFTATWPTEEKASNCLEAIVGPCIGEFTIQEAVEKGILAKPQIEIIRVPFSQEIKQIGTYQNTFVTEQGERRLVKMGVYDAGIVYYRPRNELIVDRALKSVEAGETVLVLVTRVEHGKELQKIFRERGWEIPFVQGESKLEFREAQQYDLNKGEIPCAIANRVWREGVNIPHLNTVVYAAAGKSDLNTLQYVGRNLTKAPGKDHATIVDFFDPSSHHLIGHFGQRLTLYMENKWQFTPYE